MPELVVVTGPCDAGKIRLVESVMRETEKNDQLWWLHINLRDPVHHWTSVETVQESASHFYKCILSLCNRRCQNVFELAKAESTAGPQCDNH